jgi:hypothetical protein
LRWGEHYHGTNNTWTTASAYSTSNQVNWMDSTSNNFYLTGVQLELGTVATPFEHRSYGDELERCRRYFIGMPLLSTSSAAGVRVHGDTVFTFEPMRAAPSVTMYGTGGRGGSNSGKYDKDATGNVSVTVASNHEWISIPAGGSNNGYAAFNIDAEL